jgi:hypothetical protein
MLKISINDSDLQERMWIGVRVCRRYRLAAEAGGVGSRQILKMLMND